MDEKTKPLSYEGDGRKVAHLSGAITLNPQNYKRDFARGAPTKSERQNRSAGGKGNSPCHYLKTTATDRRKGLVKAYEKAMQMQNLQENNNIGILDADTLGVEMKIALIDVDGHNFPNLPLMKISAWHKAQGGSVEWYEPLFSQDIDICYMSKVFTFPDHPIYYELIPKTRTTAYGLLTRGCPRGCGFCIVKHKEGMIEAIRRMKIKRMHFVWDRYAGKDFIIKELRMFKDITGWNREKLGVYVLTNFNTTHEQDLERVEALKEMGFNPYVMIYEKEKLPVKHIKAAATMAQQSAHFPKHTAFFSEYMPNALKVADVSNLGEKAVKNRRKFITHYARLLHYIPDKNRLFPQNPVFSSTIPFIFFTACGGCGIVAYIIAAAVLPRKSDILQR